MRSEEPILSVSEAIQRGLEHHQAGRLPDAERIYQRVLRDQPNNPDALHLLGLIAHQVGQNEISVQLIDKAIRYCPSNPHFFNNRGLALLELKRGQEALASYDKALTIKPDYADALNNRGLALHEFVRYDEALASYDKALAINPDNPGALSNRGNTLQKLDRYHEALASYDKALAINPDYAEPLSNRGLALYEMGRYDEALASYDKALKIKPGYAEALNNRGGTLQRLNRHEEALACYDKALTIKPYYAQALGGRGLALQGLNRYDEALASYDKALAIKPDYVEALSFLGNALQKLNRFDEAIACYDRALAIKRDYFEAWSNRGLALHALKRCDEALASYEKALAIKADYALALWNESLCRLLIGDFERGWKKYEWRWKTEELSKSPRTFSQPLWLGKEDIAGKTILLHAEQGLGDTIQFARYAQAVAGLGAVIILEVQPTLKPLLSNISGAYRVLSQGDPLPAFDFHCPLLSLPLAFNTRLETVPATIPYLRVRGSSVSDWREKLAGDGKRLVGLCWKGSPTYERDSERSLRLAELRPLLNCSGIRFVSLQKDLDDEERAITKGMQNFIHPGQNFQDSAEMIGALDLVISVDTAWAHWAGAIGKPLWVLLSFIPHWCWLLDRDDSPWYPTARLFRQTRRSNWENVIDMVKDEISRTPR
jgi:tetratricopeptide (TPR) repeat protein